MGNSTLSFKDEEIICYHRTMYGRWYAGKSSDRYNYWPTVVFCPIAAEDRSICKLIQNEQGSFIYKIKVKKKWWESSFKPHRKTMFEVAAKVSSSNIYSRTYEHTHNYTYAPTHTNIHNILYTYICVVYHTCTYQIHIHVNKHNTLCKYYLYIPTHTNKHDVHNIIYCIYTILLYTYIIGCHRAT